MRATRSLLALLLGLAAACGPRAGQEELVVFAAASLSGMAEELAAGFADAEGDGEPLPVTFNFAGSNTLAQQIEAAPGADVFLSADGEWIDVLERAGRVVPGSRRAILANRMVLVARRDSPYRLLSRPRQLTTAGYRHLALADPAAVPAGRYARALLAAVPLAGGGDLWSAVAPRVAPALDVRAALALVESDPEILGIVYRTDVAGSERVGVLYEFPPRPEVPITYYGVLIAGGSHPAAGRRFLDFLASPEGRALGERHGFLAPPADAS